MKNKILFIHNKCPAYRKPIFNRLAGEYDLSFIFTGESWVEGINAKTTTLNRIGFGRFSVAPGLIPKLLADEYDLLVFPPMDSPGELIDNLICFLLAKVRGKPYMVWSERWNPKKTNASLVKKIYFAFDKAIFGIISKNASVCATSGGIKQKEYFLSLGVREEKIFIIQYATSTEDMDDAGGAEIISEELGLGNKKIVLYVGRLIKRKGLNYLIDSFGKLRKERDDVCLLIVGGEGFYGKTYEDSFSLEELKNQAGKAGLKINEDIFFIGDVEHKDLGKYYQLCDVFVLPGITNVIAEPWGLVLNEAMSFGKPVISTDAVGAAYDLIKDGVNGYMVSERDADALYTNIKKILLDTALEEKMGHESRKIIMDYSYDKMLESFRKAINYAIKT